MLALARFTLKGPYQAAAVVGLLAVLAVLIPPMAQNTVFGVLGASLCMLLSCALVGLIILTQGSASGLKAIAVSIAGITLVAWALMQAPELGLWTALVQWTPVILLAQTLRSSKSLALTLLVGLALGAVGVAAQYLVWSDLETQWLAEAQQRMQQVPQLSPEMAEQHIQLVRLFVLALVAMAYLIFVLVMLTARWMQARLAESEGFADEFKSLTLGKPAAVAALGMMVASFLLQQPWLSSLAFLMVIAFMFQGIAVVHSKLGQRKQGGFLLGLFYLLLLVFPQVVALTAITGMIDNWVVFRKKAEPPTDDNES